MLISYVCLFCDRQHSMTQLLTLLDPLSWLTNIYRHHHHHNQYPDHNPHHHHHHHHHHRRHKYLHIISRAKALACFCLEAIWRPREISSSSLGWTPPTTLSMLPPSGNPSMVGQTNKSYKTYDLIWFMPWSGGNWAQMESHARDLAVERGLDLVVYTGMYLFLLVLLSVFVGFSTYLFCVEVHTGCCSCTIWTGPWSTSSSITRTSFQSPCEFYHI